MFHFNRKLTMLALALAMHIAPQASAQNISLPNEVSSFNQACPHQGAMLAQLGSINAVSVNSKAMPTPNLRLTLDTGQVVVLNEVTAAVPDNTYWLVISPKEGGFSSYELYKPEGDGTCTWIPTKL